MNIVIVITKSELNNKKILKKFEKYIYALEIRIDTFYPKIYNISKIIKKLKALLPKSKIILTFRSKNEGGKTKISEIERKNILINLISNNYKLIDYIDIEYYSKIKKDIAQVTKKYKKTLIISTHLTKEINAKNFKKILNLMAKFYKYKKIIKIVMKTNNLKYYFNLLKIVYNSKFKNITFFTIGKTSIISRSIALLLKMPLIYTSIKKPVISSQPNLKKIIEILEKLGLK